jgi:hypothetical protein
MKRAKKNSFDSGYNPVTRIFENASGHGKISPGDIIQIDKEFYLVSSVGARKIRLFD